MASIIKVDTIQTAAGGTPTAADLGLNTTGSVLQVVQAVEQRASSANSSATSYTNVTGLECAITPTSASSKILVQASFYVHTQSLNYSRLTLFRDSTNLATNGDELSFVMLRGDGDTNGGGGNGFGSYGMLNLQFLDSPNSTSQLVYTLKSKRVDPQNNSIYFQEAVNTIIAMEIAG